MNSTQDNATVVNFDSKVVDEIFEINYLSAFILGIISNTLLIYLILRRSPANLRPYCPILLITAFTDGFAILMFGLGQMDMRMIDYIGLFQLNGPVKYLPELGQCIALAFVLFSLDLEVLILLLENWFRYRFVKTRSAVPLKQLLCRVFIILFVCSLKLPVLVSDYVYYRKVNDDYRASWPQKNVNSYIMIIHFRINVAYQLYGAAMIAMFSGASLLSICLAIWSVRIMKKELTNMSKKTKDLLSQFTRTIVLRLILFEITNVLPIFINQIAWYLAINATNINIASLLLHVWLPTINCIFSIGFIKAFRQTVFQSLRASSRLLNSQPQSFVTRVHSLS
ncbi:hypothetical protein M3Y95_00825800 [Aphelenchoides besseyi]|nr:hypothetical protein M3Y95_00825800 [Aphelenchoides besseyi]